MRGWMIAAAMLLALPSCGTDANGTVGGDAQSDAALAFVVGADPSEAGMVNAQRAVAGAGALVRDARLDSVAAAYAAEMQQSGHYDHIGLDGRSPGDRARTMCQARRVGENIAWGQKFR